MWSREGHSKALSQRDSDTKTPFSLKWTANIMLFTCIKDNYLNALLLFIRSSCFSHMGEDVEVEMDKRKKKKDFSPSFSIRVAAHSAKKTSLWVLFINVLAWIVLSEASFSKSGVSAGLNVFWAVDVAVRHRLTPTETRNGFLFLCFFMRPDSKRIERHKHVKAGNRYFINTWEWLWRWAFNYKCNFISAVSPLKEQTEEDRSNFKL